METNRDPGSGRNGLVAFPGIPQEPMCLVGRWWPSLVKLAEKLWIGEGSAIYNRLQQIDQCHHQAGDQEEGHERTEMSPGFSQNVAQTTFIVVMSGATGGRQRQTR